MPSDIDPTNALNVAGSSRADVVGKLLSEKILELTNVIGTLEVGPVVDQASDELDLCTAWAVALNDAGTVLPPPSDDQPLLDAIAAVDQALAVSTGANNIASAVSTLIATYKAPGG
jgi:hypothetical protein